MPRGRREKTEAEKERGALLGTRVQKRREERGLTQPGLSVVSGVPLATIQKIEGKKVSDPGVFTLWDLAEALDTKPEKFVPPKMMAPSEKGRGKS